MKAKLKAEKRQWRKRVRIVFHNDEAQAVSIAGTFNDWRPQVSPMIVRAFGYWTKDLTLAPGRYEYRLVVDGKWIHDPKAVESAPNPFGELNSVLVVPQRETSKRDVYCFRSERRKKRLIKVV